MNLFRSSLLLLSIPLSLSAQEKPTVDQFHDRLKDAYNQLDQNTQAKQVIIMTVETVAAFQSNRWIKEPDTKAINNLMREVSITQKLQTKEDYEKLITDLKANPANYIEILQDNKGSVTVQDLHLRSEVIYRIQELQNKIESHRVSNTVNDKMRGYLIFALEEQIAEITADKRNYIEASKIPKNTEILTRQLNPQVASNIYYYGARQMVAMTAVQKEVKIKDLSQKLKVAAGRTFKGQAVRAVNVIIRGAQIAIMVDVGYRLYVVFRLHNDPGLLPLNDLYCKTFDCVQEVESFLDHTSKLYGTL